MGLVTIGYEGRSAAELIDALVRAGVDVLVDVRFTPMSRKAGMSKRRLDEALAAVGIDYAHLPELGNPPENRDAYRAGDAAARSRLRQRLRTAAGRAAVQRVVELAINGTAALLCLEREPENCHRSQVADEAHRLAPDLTVDHIR
jgi:uncharacterized protein (DUF488 family)